MDVIKIKDLFYEKLKMSYPMIEGDEYLIDVVSILSNINLDSIIIRTSPLNKTKIVSGYSILRGFVKEKIEDIWGFLYKEAKSFTVDIESFDINDEATTLLRYLSTYTVSQAAIIYRDFRTIITLRDILNLILDYQISIDIKLEELVSSNLIVISQNSTIYEAIREMVSNKVRRLFIEKSGEYITDRIILGFLFSPYWLSKLRSSEESLLDSNIEKLPKKKPFIVEKEISVIDAAKVLLTNDIIFYKGLGIITPYDLTAKPFIMNKFKFVEKKKDFEILQT